MQRLSLLAIAMVASACTDPLQPGPGAAYGRATSTHDCSAARSGDARWSCRGP